LIQIAQRLRIPSKRLLDAVTIAVRGSPRYRDQRTNAAHALVARRLSREHQAQGDEGFVGRAHADRIECTIKRRRGR